jgi:glycosyltransferase involved in cell wall biosynthesis
MKAASTATDLRYVLVTPARNEAGFIERTLQSVVAQTRLPLRWVIVSDGSTDGTDDIVQKFAEVHPWIELIRVAGSEERSFVGKAHAFNTGYKRLSELPYDVLGNIDADLSFDAEYFAFLMEKFASLPDLGVAGTPYLDGGKQIYDYRFTSIQHISGCCQLFRRECLNALDGYLPVDGGMDTIAVMTARMLGWKTRTFVEKVAVHHRDINFAGRSPRASWFRQGEKDYLLGNHPVWQVARTVYQSTRKPYLTRGLLLWCGYTYAFLQRAERRVSNELRQFHQAEQRQRLMRIALSPPPIGRPLQPTVHGADLSLSESLFRLESWVEGHDYMGYEPFDGLGSYIRPLTFGNLLLDRILIQAVRRSPLNLRPLLGIKPLESTKGRGYMARGFLARSSETGRDSYREKAVACLEWLIRHKSPLYPEYSWGNHFDYATRAGRFSAHESTIVWTALIGQAFLDGYEALSEERYLDVAKSICRWILKLPRETTANGACLSYVASRQLSIHNSNLLGAAILARTAMHTVSGELLAVARAAMEYSCSAQLSDGAWYYGEGPIYHWIDSFHTGYNLDSIASYIESTGDQTFRPHLERGFHYFKMNFVEPDGTPKYYHSRTYPIDIQCAAQAIETFAKFSQRDPEALPTAERIARWTIRHMQDPVGYFYYRRSPRFITRTPMLHWGQATMYSALALLSLQLERSRRQSEDRVVNSEFAREASHVASFG